MNKSWLGNKENTWRCKSEKSRDKNLSKKKGKKSSNK